MKTVQDLARELRADPSPAAHIDASFRSGVILLSWASPASWMNFDHARERFKELFDEISSSQDPSEKRVDISLLLIQTPKGFRVRSTDRMRLLAIVQNNEEFAKDPFLTENDWLLLSGSWLSAIRLGREVHHRTLSGVRMASQYLDELKIGAPARIMAPGKTPKPFAYSLLVKQTSDSSAGSVPRLVEY